LIPYPIRVEIQQEAAAGIGPAAAADALRSVEIFAPLTDRQRADLASASRHALYAAGEKIVREGDTGSSMFVINRGDATVMLAGTDGEVARLGPGDFFGEMSLLTGEPRSATVSAATDCELVELGVDGFRRVVLADPALVERVAAAVVRRRTELEAHRLEKGARSAAAEAPQTLVVRIRQFLRLSLS
jgi:CRP-like cAMP-binding protein